MRTCGRMRNRGIRTKQELQELYEHLDTVADINPGEVAPTHYLYEVAWGIS